MGTIRAGLATALAVPNAVAPYTYNLAGVGQVVHGKYASPPVTALPFAMITDWSLPSAHGPQLGRYERRPQFMILLGAPVTEDTVDVRVTAAEHIAQDACIAIERAVRGVGGALASTVLDVIVSNIDPIEAMQGDGYAGFALVVLTVDLYYRVDSTGGI